MDGVAVRPRSTVALAADVHVTEKVTVVVHDKNFSDQTSCTFWVPAGQARRPYRILGYATQAWANATLSFYPATTGTSSTHAWLQLDDVTFDRTMAGILGTECIEPDWFQPPDVTMNVELTGTGTVSSNPGTVVCTGGPQTCPATFADGTVVTFTAAPATGQMFSGWGGVPQCAGSAAATCQLPVHEAQLVVARFDPQPTASALKFYHTDALGSVRAITDASGTVLTRYDYFPFGESSAPLAGDPRRCLTIQVVANGPVKLGSTLQWEIEYLLNKGYTWSKGGDVLLPPLN